LGCARTDRHGSCRTTNTWRVLEARYRHLGGRIRCQLELSCRGLVYAVLTECRFGMGQEFGKRELVCDS